MNHRHGVVVTVAAGIILLAAFAPADQPEAVEEGAKGTPGYIVVFADGTVVPAKAKPISAFGSLRYVDATGRTQVVPVGKVNLDATRAANARVPDDGDGGTLSVGGGVTIQEPEPGPELGPTPTEVKKLKKKSVTVYSATWCGYCSQLKKFLAANKISARIIEVDLLPESEQAKTEAKMRQLTGRTSYPTVVIGGEAHVGYSPSWIKSKLAG